MLDQDSKAGLISSRFGMAAPRAARPAFCRLRR